jgi:hypothetical protein
MRLLTALSAWRDAFASASKALWDPFMHRIPSTLLSVCAFLALAFAAPSAAFDEAFDEDGSRFFVSPVIESARDCRAFAYRMAGMCDSNECRGALMRMAGYCRTSDCRAIAWNQSGLCDTADCRAIVMNFVGMCRSDNCRAALGRNPGFCR